MKEGIADSAVSCLNPGITKIVNKLPLTSLLKNTTLRRLPATGIGIKLNFVTERLRP